MKKWILTFSVLTAALNLNAQQAETLTTNDLKDMTLQSSAQSNTLQQDEFTLEQQSQWQLEAQLQSNSISRLGVFGPSLGLKTSERTIWGGRFLSTMSDSGSNSFNRIQGFTRYQHTQRATALISDFTLSHNMSRDPAFSNASYQTLGYSIGIQRKINPEFSFGATLGAEYVLAQNNAMETVVAQGSFDANGNYFESTEEKSAFNKLPVIKPTVSIFGQMNF